MTNVQPSVQLESILLTATERIVLRRALEAELVSDVCALHRHQEMCRRLLDFISGDGLSITRVRM